MPTDEDLRHVATKVSECIQEDWPVLQVALNVPDHIMLDVLSQRTIVLQVYRCVEKGHRVQIHTKEENFNLTGVSVHRQYSRALYILTDNIIYWALYIRLPLSIHTHAHRLLKEWRNHAKDCSKEKLAECLVTADKRLEIVSNDLFSATK